MKRALAVAALLGGILAGSQPLFAQSLASGVASGRVVDEAGIPVYDAQVRLVTRTGGLVGQDITDRLGQFTIARIPAGEYQLYVEAIGFNPAVIRSVSVQSGFGAPWTVSVRGAQPPVVAVDTIGALATGAANAPGTGHRMGGVELHGLPDRDRFLTDLLEQTTLSDGTEALAGQPGTWTRLYLDGMYVPQARLPGAGTDPLFGLLAPRIGLSGVEVVYGGAETEWDSGASVSVLTRPGGSRFGVEAFADYSGGSLWSSAAVTDVPAHQNLRAGAVLDIPIVPDTASLRAGVELFRLERPTAALLPGGAPAFLSNAFGTDTALVAPVTLGFDAVAGFVRADLAPSPESRITLRGHVASVVEPDLRVAPLTSLREALSGRDAAFLGTLSTPVGDDNGLEVKAGFTQSRRTLGGGAGSVVPYTTTRGVPFAVGYPGAVPASVERSDFMVQPNFMLDLDEHQVKIGARLAVQSHTYDAATPGTSRFSLGTQPGTGMVRQLAGQGVVDFSFTSFSAWAQDTWDAAPGVQVRFGIRNDLDVFPDSDITPQPILWDSLAVDRNVQVIDTVATSRAFSTRFGLGWDVAEQGRTYVDLGASLSYEPYDPGLVHEWVTGDGTRSIVETTATGAWPAGPATSTGGAPWFTLWDGDPKRAKTARAHASIRQRLSDGLALQVGGSFRRTEDIIRRTNLNLTPVPSGMDASGRPVWGRLLQTDGVVFGQPTLNRRFDAVGVADALIADGWSRYLDATVGLDYRGRSGLSLFTRYTFSRTEDNMVGWGGGLGSSAHSPFQGVDGFTDWEEGRSDFDLPHRFFAGFEFDLPGAPVRLTGAYRMRSGAAFTPGFDPGVDINGDGWAGNDPAFAAALPTLPAGVTCDAPGGDGLFARNACRAPSVQSFDLRATATLAFSGGSVDLSVDGLNLIEPEIGLIDSALWQVAGDVSTQGTTVTIPLTANPNFGNWAVRGAAGRMIRFHVKVTR